MDLKELKQEPGGEKPSEDPDTTSNGDFRTVRNRRNQKKNIDETTLTRKFKGGTHDREDFYFVICATQADSYVKTSDNIAEYDGRIHSEEVKVTIEGLEAPSDLFDWLAKPKNEEYLKNEDVSDGDIP